MTPMVGVFLLFAGIKIPGPGSKAFKSVDGDQVNFGKIAVFGACFQNKGFFPEIQRQNKKRLVKIASGQFSPAKFNYQSTGFDRILVREIKTNAMDQVTTIRL